MNRQVVIIFVVLLAIVFVVIAVVLIAAVMWLFVSVNVPAPTTTPPIIMPAATPAEALMAEPIVITIAIPKNDQVIIGDRSGSLSKIDGMLAAELESLDDPLPEAVQVEIVVNSDVEFTYVVAVMNACNKVRLFDTKVSLGED